MRMLVADDNAAFRQFVATTIGNSLGYEIIQASTGTAALRMALSQPAPDILLLDWVMPEMTGTQVCKLVRASRLPHQPYIAFATARIRAEELITALSAGADDLMTKPIAPDVLIARLSVPKARLPTQSPKRIWAEIVQACERKNGELAVTSGALTARILVCNGRIAWAHLADASDNLFEALSPDGSISPDMAQALLMECRTTGKTISETLVDWGLMDRARLREALRGWIERKLDAICNLPSPSTLFLPGERACAQDILFDLAEVTPSTWSEEDLRNTLPPGSISQSPTLVPGRGWDTAFTPMLDESVGVESLLQKCLMVQGVRGVALINRGTGGCLGRRGEELDPDLVWSMLQCINTAERNASVDEAIVTTTTHFHFASLLANRPELFVYALVDSTENLAAARYGLKKVVKGDQ